MESRPTSCATWPRPLPLLCRPMSLAVRTRCSSAHPAPACRQWGRCTLYLPPPPPLPFCLLTCRAHSFPCAQADAQFEGPRTDRSAPSECDGQRQRVPPLLTLRDRGREDRHALPLAAPPLLRSVAPPSPAPAGATTILAPRAGTTYLLHYHSSPLLAAPARLRLPSPTGCTPPPVTPARRSVAPLFLPLMPPPERPPTPKRRAPIPPACCPTTEWF